jgi:hypothetical protein
LPRWDTGVVPLVAADKHGRRSSNQKSKPELQQFLPDKEV